jgi:chromate transporter
MTLIPEKVNDKRVYSLIELTLYFLKLGTFGFGGPIALVGYMERDLMEEKGWFTKEEFTRGLALAQLAPGPLAAQLAIYLGYLKGDVLGATLVALAFILPSFFMVLVLGWLYVHYGELPWMRAAFYGIGAAVIGIITKSAHKLTKITLKKKRLLWGIFTLMALVTAYTEREIAWLFILCGLVALMAYAPIKFKRSSANAFALPFMLPLMAAQTPFQSGTGWDILIFFAKAGAFVFGSGLAIVPFLHGGVVQEFQWLTEQQFLDAVAVAMITPGPVVITVAFIGYLVAGLKGAILAAIGVFLPCYLFVVFPARYYERYAHNKKLSAFVEGVSAAATGAIAGAVFVLGKNAIFDIPTTLFAVVTLLILIRWKIQEPIIITIAGLLGLIFHQVS